jgi:excinuclease UvrABC nuclease subunit
VVKQLPGVGKNRAHAITRTFSTVWWMAHASETEWACIPGIGPRLANRIWRALRGDHSVDGDWGEAGPR